MVADENTLVFDQWRQAAENSQPMREPRRVHGLRVTRVPSGALLAQILGAVALMVGVFLLAGTAVTLISGGGAAVILGTLKEAGLLDAPEDGKG